MNEPQEHDYPSARDYMTLISDDVTAEKAVNLLKGAPLIHRKAKDLLRAGGVPLLSANDSHVAKDLKKVKKGNRLSPVLLVRGDATRGVPLIIADGYHRICASYHIDEDADIPCQLVELD
ncbi:MAG: hypothetical protein ACYDHP_02170 [Ferrimicrobium sp.]